MPVLAEYRARVAAGSIEHDPAQERAAVVLSELSRELRGWSPGLKAYVLGRGGPGLRGVYLWGGVGRGKSMLMDMFFDAAPAGKKRRVHFHAFMQRVHAEVRAARAARVGDPVGRAAKVISERSWLLCFDELHVTDIGDAMILGRLFEALFGRGVVMVATSNRRPSDLYKDGLNRQLFLPAIHLLRTHMQELELDAARDFRLERLEAGSTWMTPLGPDATARLDASWRRLTCGDAERGEVLTVLGRQVRAPRTAGGAARFGFDQLFAQPLGAADYLMLAERFHTIFIDDVPLLGPEKRNEAKRFVTFVDALYEHKTKLVASAAAEPAGLYPAGDGAFEFERAASRLIEMRSHDYLAAPRAA